MSAHPPANRVLDGHGVILRKGGGHVHKQSTASGQGTVLAQRMMRHWRAAACRCGPSAAQQRFSRARVSMPGGGLLQRARRRGRALCAGAGRGGRRGGRRRGGRAPGLELVLAARPRLCGSGRALMDHAAAAAGAPGGGPAMMLSLPTSVRIWLASRRPTCANRSTPWPSWCGSNSQRDPLSGQLFVFRNKRADRVKLLYWDEDGFVIVYKRLEAGTFRFPAADGGGRGDSRRRLADAARRRRSGQCQAGRRYRRPMPA